MMVRRIHVAVGIAEILLALLQRGGKPANLAQSLAKHASVDAGLVGGGVKVAGAANVAKGVGGTGKGALALPGGGEVGERGRSGREKDEKGEQEHAEQSRGRG